MVRLAYIDYIKALAILLVLLTHSHELANINSVSLTSILYSIDRTGVPLFLMVSGILTLENAKNKGLKVFKSPRLYQFIILLIFYCILTNTIYYHFAKGHEWLHSFKVALEYNNLINYGRNGHAVHLWYMYLFVSLYILSPYISKLVTSCSDDELFVYILICIVLNQTAISYDTYMAQGSLLNALYKDMTGPCLSFFIFGYWYCRKYHESERNVKNMFIGAILFVAIVLLKHDIETTQNKIIWAYNWYGSSITIVISSFGLFAFIFEFTKKLKPLRLVTIISKLSFGVYLLHYSILLAFSYHFNESISKLDLSMRIILLFFVSLVTIPICFLLSKNKLTRWFTGG